MREKKIISKSSNRAKWLKITLCNLHFAGIATKYSNVYPYHRGLEILEVAKHAIVIFDLVFDKYCAMERLIRHVQYLLARPGQL